MWSWPQDHSGSSIFDWEKMSFSEFLGPNFCLLNEYASYLHETWYGDAV